MQAKTDSVGTRAPFVCLQPELAELFRPLRRKRGGLFLDDPELSVMYDKPDMLAQSIADDPLSAVESDRVTARDRPTLLRGNVQIKHMGQRSWGIEHEAFGHALLVCIVRDLPRRPVDMRAVPVTQVLIDYGLRVQARSDTHLAEHGRQPVLERAHRALYLPLGLRTRGDTVLDTETPEHPPASCFDVLPLVSEHGEPVGVDAAGDAHPLENPPEENEVLPDRLPITEGASDHLPRGVVDRHNEGLLVPDFPPDMHGCGIVLPELARRPDLPALHGFRSPPVGPRRKQGPFALAEPHDRGPVLHESMPSRQFI